MDQTKPETVYVRQLALGPKKNFVYLVGAVAGREAFVIDPAWDVASILSTLETDGRALVGIVLTHHHDDHVNGVPGLLAARDVPVVVQRAELDFAPGVFERYRGALRVVDPGAQVRLAGLDVGCLHTPGHTPGSQCVRCGGVVFTGDTLFVNACGRCDFAGGDPRAMHRSLFEVLGALPGETTVFAGHDYGDVKVSSLARERAQNPYFRLGDVAEFVKYRMR